MPPTPPPFSSNFRIKKGREEREKGGEKFFRVPGDRKSRLAYKQALKPGKGLAHVQHLLLL